MLTGLNGASCFTTNAILLIGEGDVTLALEILREVE